MKIFEELNQTGIPKLFWYTISFCLIFIVILFAWMALKYQNINFEFANTKIQIVSSISQVEKATELIKSKEAQMEKENSELKDEIATLEKENTELKKSLTPVVASTRPALAAQRVSILKPSSKIEKVTNDTLEFKVCKNAI